MKSLAFVCTLLVSGSVFATVVASDKIEVKEGIFVDKNGQPFTGTFEHKFPNNKVFLRVKSDKGVSSESTMFYPNGHKRMHDTGRIISYYHEDETLSGEIFRSGDTIVLEKWYYPNGQVAQEIPHQQNGIGGTVKLYDMGGELIEERPYVTLAKTAEKEPDFQAIRNGKATVYTPQKNVMSEVYDMGMLKEIQYHDRDGKELRIVKQAVSALPVGIWRDISSDLNKACSLSKKDNFSGLMLIEDQGTLLQIICEKGQIDGWVRILSKTQPWLVSHTPYKKGKKNGTQIRYGGHDLLMSGLIPYKKDVINGTVYLFVPTNKLDKVIPYKDGQPSGIVKTYAVSNNQDVGNVVIMEEPMKNGKLNGIVKLYNKMGDVIAERVFKEGIEVQNKKDKNEKTDKKSGKNEAKKSRPSKETSKSKKP